MYEVVVMVKDGLGRPPKTMRFPHQYKFDAEVNVEEIFKKGYVAQDGLPAVPQAKVTIYIPIAEVLGIFIEEKDGES